MMFGLVFATALAGAASFDAEAIPRAQAAVAAACGVKPAIVVRWDDFGDDAGGAQNLIEGGLEFLEDAFATVCKDPALKAEVARQIKKIALAQASGAADPVIYLSEGTLNVEYFWVKGDPPPNTDFVAAEIAARLNGEEAEAP